jgi:hypothetical protein
VIDTCARAFNGKDLSVATHASPPTALQAGQRGHGKRRHLADPTHPIRLDVADLMRTTCPVARERPAAVVDRMTPPLVVGSRCLRPLHLPSRFRVHRRGRPGGGMRSAFSAVHVVGPDASS